MQNLIYGILITARLGDHIAITPSSTVWYEAGMELRDAQNQDSHTERERVLLCSVYGTGTIVFDLSMLDHSCVDNRNT